MKSYKRDGEDRAFNNGYRAAILGRSISRCPHEKESLRFQWTAGWREGREDYWSGNASIAGLHKV